MLGHHSHCPQPVSLFNFNTINKLVAYSLGNFCYNIDNKMFETNNYGIAIKIEINKEGKSLIENVNWTFLKSSTPSKKECIVRTASKFSNFYD